MYLAPLAFLTGVMVVHQQSHLPDWPGYWPLAALLALWGCSRNSLLRLLLWGMMGMCWTLALAQPYQNQLPTSLESVDLQVEGWIASLPEPVMRGSRFRLQVATLRHRDRIIPFHGALRLTWYQPYPALQVGDRWRMTVRLKRPPWLANPVGFDYPGWLYQQGIHASGYVRAAPAAEQLMEAERFPLGRWRQRVARRLADQLSDAPLRGMIMALAVGERSAISERQWQVLRRTGTAHLVAISGLHIGLVAGLVFMTVSWLWTRLPWGHCQAAPRVAAPLAMLAAGGYTALAGASLSTQRAFVMVTLSMLAVLWTRPMIPGRILGMALVVVLLLDPWAPLTAGFWLSFGAVAVIFYSLAGQRWPQRRDSGAGLQWRIALALLPITLAQFQTVTPLSPLINLIAIPWMTLIVIPLTLISVAVGEVSMLLQGWGLGAARETMAWLWGFLVWSQTPSWALWHAPAPGGWGLAAVTVGVALLLLPRGFPCRWVGLVLLLPLFPAPLPLTEGELQLDLLDTDDGFASVIRTRDQVLVYDTGPQLGPNLDGSLAAVLPLLHQQGQRQVDRLIISDTSSRVSGGARSLTAGLRVMRTQVAFPAKTPVQGAEVCPIAEDWQWNGVIFRLLPIDGDGPGGTCVLWVETAQGALLFPGRTGNAVASWWRRQATRYPLPVTVVMAAPAAERAWWLADLAPQRLLLAGQASSDTMTGDWSQWTTHEAGALRLRLGGPVSAEPTGFREQRRRYWHPSTVPDGD